MIARHTCSACFHELDGPIFMSLLWSECESEGLELPSEPQTDVLMLLKPLGTSGLVSRSTPDEH